MQTATVEIMFHDDAPFDWCPNEWCVSWRPERADQAGGTGYELWMLLLLLFHLVFLLSMSDVYVCVARSQLQARGPS